MRQERACKENIVQDHISSVLEPSLVLRTTGVGQEKAVCRIGNRCGIFKIHHDECDYHPCIFPGCPVKTL